MSLYSRESTPPPVRYRHDIPEKSRRRVLAAIEQILGLSAFSGMDSVLDFVGKRIIREHGGILRVPEVASMGGHRVVDHFFYCPVPQFIDFIQMAFEHPHLSGKHTLVEAINRVFEQDAIPFEFLKQERLSEDDDSDVPTPFKMFGGSASMPTFAALRVVQKTDEQLHRSAVQPALQVLHDPKFATANRELQIGMDHCRHARYADAITSCGAAVESTMKTICHHKGWPYDQNKDTYAKLVAILQQQSLFPPGYRPLLESIGTIRNKMGDAHGKGPEPEYAADQPMAEHMVHCSCSTILLLISLAKL